MADVNIESEGTVRLIVIDTSVYGEKTALKSAYRFSDKAFIHIQQRAEKQIEVRLRAKNSGDDIDLLAGEFTNDLLEQRLREIVAKETEPIRDLIITHALSKTTIINGPLETMDPFPSKSGASSGSAPKHSC